MAWKERFLRLFMAEAGVPPDGFDRAFRDADDALVGTIPPTTSFGATVALVARGTSENLRLSDGGAAGRVADRFLTEARGKLSESAALLSRLAPRFRLGVVSNFYGNLVAVCAETGLLPHLSVAVDSAVVGATKPDRRIFEAALGPLGVDPEEAFFVGDSRPRDMAGAKALGLPHVWLAAADLESPEPCCPGDAVIRRLADLPGILP